MLATTQATVEFGEISKEEFCNAVSNAINAIGHESTVSLINTLCNTNLRLNRIEFGTWVWSPSDSPIILLAELVFKLFCKTS